MYDYSRLPTLVLNQVYDYLSVKERIKCKSVCRSWKAEVELREKARDSLVLHVGPYLRNMRWICTNNRSLMKFENSFQVKHLSVLKHPMTIALLKKIKKLAIVNYHPVALNAEIAHTNVHPYLRYFDQCEEMEIRNFPLRGTLKFDLPNLKVLAIRCTELGNLVLNCPSLEVLFCSGQAEGIRFRSARKLKQLFCCCWSQISLDKGRFENLGYLNLYAKLVNDQMLDLMPKLKRLVLYSRNLLADLKNIRAQQARNRLNNLEVLCSGFRDDPVRIELRPDLEAMLAIDSCVGELFDNYSKLVENSPWRVWIDYSKLFGKFKILPNNFIERFSEPYRIKITNVTNYTHLFEFLRCYPFVQQLRIDFSKVQANRILDTAFLLIPSLTELTIVEERWSKVLEIDLSFMGLFDLVYLQLVSTRLPIEFIRKVAAKRGPHFAGFTFTCLTPDHEIGISFYPHVFVLVDTSCGSAISQFATLEELISAFKSHPHLNKFLCGV